ncbi:hypothetical protein ACJMK2_036840 [Sinanodonta woodiana]|uniref:General transcription factor II-I repeat domain-containing protein 2 n=1 Tax=Sinanodonta woodiana TaxID=1069815 RepID=A0ABD3WJP9_SINWO
MAANRKRKVDNKNRQFNDDWTVQNCFVQHQINVICLLFYSTVAVAKVSNMKHHYEKKHQDFHNVVGDGRTARIESLRHSLNRQQNIFAKQSAEFSAACEVSYEISLMIAKSGRPFTDGDFVKQCMTTASEKLCLEVVRKLQTVSLNRMTVKQRIPHLSADATRQLADKATDFFYFSLAANESTDIISTAQLLVCVLGVSSSFDITEEFIGMGSMKGQTTASALFEGTVRLCSSVLLDFTKLISVITDGAPAMTGKSNGLVALLMKQRGKQNRQLVMLHCIIHQQNLCSKELGFQPLMALVTITFNFIKSRGLNHRQF